MARAWMAALRVRCSFFLRSSLSVFSFAAVSARVCSARMRSWRVRKAACSGGGGGRLAMFFVLARVVDVRARPRVQASRASVWRARWRRARAER